MTAVAPQAPGSSTSTPADPSAASQLSWEGDKMFNIYIYDYCHKRGFRKTARELLQEAEIPVDSTPPINARQGLLFEWWSVFWVLFTAKANGSGTEDAMLYTQHQAHQAAMKQNQARAQGQQPTPLSTGQMPPRGPNGIGPGPPQQRFPPNGVMPNGIPVNGPPAGPTGFPAGPMGQPNGIMPGGGPPPGMGGQSFMPGRPPTMGQPRPPNGGGPPFQSPTMAHSPPNPGQQQQHPPPMGQLPPRGMPPPGQQGMNPGQQTPTPMYQNIAGQPPSRTSTPSGGLMPSPSMGNRQPMNDPRQEANNINADFNQIPPQAVNLIKSELGLGAKDPHLLTLQEKQRILGIFRQRPKPGPPGPNPAAGPSMAPPPRRNNKRNSSTSPGEDQQQPDDGLPRTGSSPPGAKRIRRSPGDQQMPSAPMNYPQHPNQPPQHGPPGGPGGPGGPPQMGNTPMMRPMGGPMNSGFQPGQMPGQMLNMGMLGGGGGMNPMMPPSMSPQMHPQQGAMNAMQYRQGMHLQPHPNRMSGGPMNAASPGADPSFNPGMPMHPGGPPGGPQQQGPPGQPGQQFAPGNRLSGPPNTKQPMGMLPPPSPAKDQNGPKDSKPPNGVPEGSPRNQPLTGPNPPTPGPGQQQQQGPGGNNMTSPPLIMNSTANTMNPAAMALPPAPAPTGDLFGTDFMQNLPMEDFDVGLFRADGDINFERDFGQWFNPDDVGSMDLVKQ